MRRDGNTAALLAMLLGRGHRIVDGKADSGQWTVDSKADGFSKDYRLLAVNRQLLTVNCQPLTVNCQKPSTVKAQPSTSISPCRNCGHCSTTGECAVDDGMQEVYRAAESASRVALASPVYFGSLTGGLLDIMSRFQRYFKEGRNGVLPRVGPQKSGAVILTAGGSGGCGAENAERQARIFMKLLNVAEPVFITSYQTDTVSAIEDREAVGKAAELREKWLAEILR